MLQTLHHHPHPKETFWCSLNNLELNMLKTVEIIVDFRRSPPALPPLTIMNSTVTAVESFRFLGTTISQDLKWDNHIVSIVKKAQQRLYFFRQLRKFNLPQELLKQFYSAIIESVLCTSITVWFSSATKSDLSRLRRVVRTAERIVGTTLPTLQELYLSRVSKRAGKITLDPSHPAHSLFELLPSGRRYRALCTRTTRHRNSFFPKAVHLMNTSQIATYCRPRSGPHLAHAEWWSGPHVAWNDGTWADRSCLPDMGQKQAIAMPHVSQEQRNKPHWTLSEPQNLHILFIEFSQLV